MNVLAQEGSLRIRKIPGSNELIRIDTFSIYPNSFELYCGEELVHPADYELKAAGAQFQYKGNCGDSLTARYRVLPFDLSRNYQYRDTSKIYYKEDLDREKYMFSTYQASEDLFGGSGLNKSGSISRGISFGNNQDLGINSTLNLELSGDIAPNLKLMASVSDDNIPIQPDGNTNKLQEFDQVFIQIYNDNFKLITGDFWLYKPKGYFMTYKKRAQGLYIENYWQKDEHTKFVSQASGALSKGKFNRQIIQGIEGNQGPYKLIGGENEPFIIILSGTERVYIDGRLLERGQEYDYTIDYNTSEVTFTARNQITKDSRIVVEFQYSDQNYLRSLFQTTTSFERDGLKWWFNAYSEQDAKNQTIQTPLTFSQKQLMADIGDSLDLARISSIDSVGFLDNQNMYKMIDSLGYDSVLVYSIHPDSAFFKATFTYVGTNKGDYVFSNFNALGKVYKWVEPIAGVRQGDYMPSRLIVTPKQRQMVNGGVDVALNERHRIMAELAYTNYDQNTFSRYDAKDDKSGAVFLKYGGIVPLLEDSTRKIVVETKAELEYRDQYFKEIEQYRAVEFDRDWNTRGKNYLGNQLATKLGANLKHSQNGNINLEAQQYAIGNDFSGLRAATDGKWKQNGFSATWDGSYLSSDAGMSNRFFRHRADISQAIGPIRIGYKDDHENNTFRDDVLETNSYEFFDYQFYLMNGDTSKNTFKAFYRERLDRRSDSTRLQRAAKARTTGAEFGFNSWKNQRLTIITSYRELKAIDSTLISITPENTLLGRVDYEINLWKGALRWNTFYEIGSGLELKREFLYIKVNDGQGIYTWIDYNNDGVKDLNEFEIAQYVDQASYIRVFTPSNEYVKTYSNEFNQSVFWKPERLWANKKGALKMVSRFSDQLSIRIKTKTSDFVPANSFNPFFVNIADTSLISNNSNIRNAVFFNRTSSIAGADYIYQQTTSKTLLASGFDSRSHAYHELVFRWNIKRKFTVKLTSRKGIKSSGADYTAGRNFRINYVSLEPSLIYQPNTVFRITLDGRAVEKQNNQDLGGERATVMEIGTTCKFNQPEKGSFQGSFKSLHITYNGEQSSALGFEMLEALKPGVNFTWSMGYQRSISRNLQLTFQYTGRKSPTNRPIHSGGMELRAFF